MSRRYTTLILVLILTILNSCKKEGALQPLLPGQWKSTSDLQISFDDGNFNVRYENPAFGSSFHNYSGTYTLEGNDIYMNAIKLEWYDHSYMAEPEIRIFEKPRLEHYKFWIRDGELHFDPVRPNINYVMIDTKSVYVKTN